MMNMKTMVSLFLAASVSFGWVRLADAQDAEKGKPTKILYITGGGYHDYKNQVKILSEGIGERTKIEWTVYSNGKDFSGLKENWADAYDVIIHNNCWAGYKDDAKIDAFVKQQKDAGVGVVVIHCAMHTFRGAKTKQWDKLVGVESSRHGAKFRIHVKTLKSDHPIMNGVPSDWVTKNGELYHTKPLESCTPLAEGSRDASGKGKQVCIWVNTFDKTRTFGITLGHHNETMKDPVYLDLMTRGVLWTCGRLKSDKK